MCPVDVKGLPENCIRYSVYPTEQGNSVDDTMITRCKDHLYIIVNSACYDKDMKHFKKYLSDYPGVKIENLYDTHAMVAIQVEQALQSRLQTLVGSQG